MDLVIAIVAGLAGIGGVSVGIAWLNDRRLAVSARRMAAIDPRETLQSRLASGDIGEDEYARRMHLLTYGPPLELDPRQDA